LNAFYEQVDTKSDAWGECNDPENPTAFTGEGEGRTGQCGEALKDAMEKLTDRDACEAESEESEESENK